MTKSPRGAAPFLIAGTLVLGMVGLSVGAAANADDQPSGGGSGLPITVIVRSSVPTPAPGSQTPTPSPSPSGSSKPSSGSGTNSGSASPSDASADEDLQTLSDADFSVGGVLYVSGVSTQYVASPNPAGGEVRASFTVRNVSSTTIDSYVSFGLTNFLGQELSSVTGITVLRLEPDETRIVRATLENAGQWAVETASYTLTPTSLVNDQRVPSVTRDSMVFFLPWLLLVIIVLGVAAYFVVRLVRANQKQASDSELVGEPA